MGGNFAEGKTSNVELDAIYKKYLPTGLTLPCSTLPCLEQNDVIEIQEKLKRRKKLFFPLFVRHHWIAGILRLIKNRRCVLEIYDSAPSPIVHKDLKKKLKHYWKDLSIQNISCPRQRPGSNDCGLFMTAAFFSEWMDIGVFSPGTLGHRLRKLLDRAKKKNIPPQEFIAEMKKELLHKDIVEGGGPRKRMRESFETELSQSEPVDPFTEEFNPIPDLESQMGEGNGEEHQEEEDGIDEVVLVDETEIEKKVRSMMRYDNNDLENVHKSALGHLWAATALANAADGESRSLHRNSIGMKMYRIQQSGRPKPRCVLDALTQVGFPPSHFKGFQRNKNSSKAVFLYADDNEELPKVKDGYNFVVGAKDTFLQYTGKEYATTVLTENHKDAWVGLYLPLGLHSYSQISQTKKEVNHHNSKEAAKNRASSQTVRQSGKSSDEQYKEMLSEQTKIPLNDHGSPERGPENCPRTWHIYSHKPSHICSVAWNALTEAVRQHHIRCLGKLKAMPNELLHQNIASSALECIRREAVARKWSPATLMKEYSAMAGALRDLPMYTTENKGVHLSDFPEWRAAQKTAKRMDREIDKNEFPAITYSQYLEAMKHLRRSKPQAALFLGMMWALAARAGDVQQLRPKDISLGKTALQDGTVPLGITQKFGKATRFRGTYWSASTLLPEEAAELRRNISQKKPTQKLFPNGEEIRTYVRTSLRTQNRLSALPSIRRGAIQHLARQGVSEASLMRLTGHKRVETLYRYIGVGPLATQEAVTARDSVKLLHRPRLSSSAQKLHPQVI